MLAQVGPIVEISVKCNGCIHVRPANGNATYRCNHQDSLKTVPDPILPFFLHTPVWCPLWPVEIDKKYGEHTYPVAKEELDETEWGFVAREAIKSWAKENEP